MVIGVSHSVCCVEIMSIFMVVTSLVLVLIKLFESEIEIIISHLIGQILI